MSPLSDATMSGRLVDTTTFRLVRKLSEGGMGAVYEAVVEGPHGFAKTVAIKTVREGLSQDAQFVDMFIGEAKLVADLVHPNICQVYQLGKIGGRYYLAMEYIAGLNLEEFMDRHVRAGTRVPPDIGTFIISRVCRGLEYAHTKEDAGGRRLGIVHRDVSPRNIMISLEGEVKLTDFGIAKAQHLMKDLEGQMLIGKARYMSPEQAQLKTTDPRSDVFSLGVVMFELLTGVPLFEGNTVLTTLQSVTEKPIPSPRRMNPDLPPNVEGILLRALERDPDRRCASAGQMGFDLEYAMYGTGYGPTTVTLEQHLRKLAPELYRPGPAQDRVPFADVDGTLSIPVRDATLGPGTSGISGGTGGLG